MYRTAHLPISPGCFLPRSPLTNVCRWAFGLAERALGYMRSHKQGTMDVYIGQQHVYNLKPCFRKLVSTRLVPVPAADQPVHARGDRPGGDGGARQPQVHAEFLRRGLLFPDDQQYPSSVLKRTRVAPRGTDLWMGRILQPSR